MKASKLTWLGRGISGLALLPFFASAYMKFWGGPEVAKGWAHLGLPDAVRMPFALVEIACVLVYLIPKTSVLGAILLTGYLGGAICAHVRVGDAFWVQAVMGVLLWAGLFFREARLRTVLPIRT